MTRQKSAMYVTAGNFVFSNIKRAYHSQFIKVNRQQSAIPPDTKKDAIFKRPFN